MQREWISACAAEAEFDATNESPVLPPSPSRVGCERGGFASNGGLR